MSESNVEKNISPYLPAWELDRDTITHLVIPEGVTKIGCRAFDFCIKLTSLVIPKSVMSIGYKAFCECLKLKSLVIPKSVMSIGHNAFQNCPSTCDIRFEKTKAEVYRMEDYPWAISTGAVIHCTDGDLTV